MTDSAKSKSKHCWCRFSLRALLVLVVLVALFLGLWLKPRIDRARRQEQAVDVILALGGKVYYDYQKTENGGLSSKRRSPVPRWLQAILGEHFCVDVICVDLCRSEIDTPTLQKLWPEIEKLDRLEYLWLLAPNAMDNDALRQLVDAVPPSLKGLDLSAAAVTDDALASLASLQALQYVVLEHTPITDKGLMTLAALPNLRNVLLGGTQVTAEGVQAFQQATPQEISFWREE